MDIVTTSKDILEDLVKSEGWEYTNLFPKGRKIKGLPTYLGVFASSYLTIMRLLKYSRRKKYDLFVANDFLTLVGRITRTPTINFQTDDVQAVPESKFILRFAKHVLAPEVTDLGKYNTKKIPFKGYKELAYLHPKVFTPDPEVVKKFNPDMDRYFVIRLVSLKATHDVGKGGIDDAKLQKLIDLLLPYGKVYLSAERGLSETFEKYRLKIDYTEIAHVLYYADMFIGDSQTMTSEAAVLGTMAIRFNDFVGMISVMEEKEYKYGLSYGFKTNQFEEMIAKIKEELEIGRLKERTVEKCEQLLNDCINLSEFFSWVYENEPESISILKENPSYQERFK